MGAATLLSLLVVCGRFDCLHKLAVHVFSALEPQASPANHLVYLLPLDIDAEMTAIHDLRQTPIMVSRVLAGRLLCIEV